MTVKDLLMPTILQELEKYERQGKKIKLKSIGKRRRKYTIICGVIALCAFADPIYLLAVPVYVGLMLKTRNHAEVILSLARKSPDKPIVDIIAEEVQV